MFVAIDRTSKFAFVELHEKATTAVSRDFLLRLIAAVPYKIHTVLTDNGIQFTTPGAGGSAVPLIKEAIANGERFWAHAFELARARNEIEHRTTKAKHPWTTDVIDKRFLIRFAIFSSGAWMTAGRRAGSEVRALPRSLYRRTSFAASVRPLRTPRVPAGDETRVSALGLFHPAALLFPVALDVVGMCCTLLAARRLVPSPEFHVAQLLGV
jgi:hypothetical protein